MSRSTGTPRSQRAKLVDHQSRRNIGGVNGTAGRASACLGLGLGKQRRGIIVSPNVVADGQDTDHFCQHPAVAPESAFGVNCSPDCCPGVDAVDTTKRHIPASHTGPIAVLNALDADCRIKSPDGGLGCLDLGLPTSAAR